MGPVAEIRGERRRRSQDRLGRFLIQRSDPLTAAARDVPLSLLRRHWPIVAARPGRLVVVTRAADVVEVLTNHDVFHVPYLPKMQAITGTFLLGLDGTARYWEERRRLEAARAPLVDGLEEASRDTASAILERIARRTSPMRLDVVEELVDPVIDEAVTRLVGLPEPSGARLAQARAVFYGVFLNPKDAPSAAREAIAASRRLGEAIAAECRRRAATGGAPARDLIGGLLAAGMDADGVVRNVIGVLAAWATSVSRAFVLGLDELLRRPEALESARLRAAEGDTDGVWRHLREAMRFQPQAPGLTRTCAAAHPLAAGTRRARTIGTGDIVLALTASAMMDGSWLDHPREFRPDRPERDYLFFGEGLHRCFGDPVAQSQMTGIACALLRAGRLRRVEGPAGRVRWSGVYPRRLVVAVEPDASSRSP